MSDFKIPRVGTGGYVPTEEDRLRAEVERLTATLDEDSKDYMTMQAEVERLRSELATCRELREYDAKDKARLHLIEEALRHIISAGGACPCGAWFGDEDRRPHAIGCPVGRAALEEEA